MTDVQNPEFINASGEQKRLDELLVDYRQLQQQVQDLKQENRKAVRRYQREQALKPYQAELIRVQQHLEETATRMIIIFEGRDAAGKGGTIRRVTRYMNEKHYRVVALGKPTETQRTQWFFQKEVPYDGKISD